MELHERSTMIKQIVTTGNEIGVRITPFELEQWSDDDLKDTKIRLDSETKGLLLGVN